LDDLAAAQGKSLAQVIREAVDAYLIDAPTDATRALSATFGAAPGITVPSREEWDRA
ncbi:MAG: Ribbon-helix-helix protein, CopG family, partial [Dehalococcoidia bacterium]|nr:Ribbon-helix-helix protein, CopG family [Dehalococcoidia bacterium]